jgi:YidC/Oxa1 family membrane protein insertase
MIILAPKTPPKPKAPETAKIETKDAVAVTKSESPESSDVTKDKPISLEVKAESKPKDTVKYDVVDTPESEPEKVELSTELFRFVFNTKGGILEALELKEFKQSFDKSSPQYKLIDRIKNDKVGCFAVEGLEEIFSKATFKITQTKKDKTTILTMQAIKQGLEVVKTIEIPEKEYDFNVNVKVTNHRPTEYVNTFKLVGVMDMEFDFKDTNSLMNDQIVTLIDDNGDFISAGDVHFWSKTYGARQSLTALKEEPFVMGPNRKTENGKHDKAKVIWGGFKNRYFAFIAKPKKINWTVNGFDLYPEIGHFEKTIPQLVWSTPELKLATGQSFEETFLVFAGPMKTSVIDAPRYAESKFVEVIDYGFMFPIFIKAFDWILNTIIKVIGEGQYWLAIILLTLLVRLCMFPITKKSSMSQAKLQTVTPKMKELKEKFKNDTKKLNEEMMKLYRKEGVNPFTSCLPMLIQMPIFIGLYWTFNLTFEVRFKSFIWINDLAVADHLFPLGITIPLIGSYFNLLPIIYSVINYITMANMPIAQDEMQAQQQKIMKYMFPVMMLFFFYTMPSALVLYFIVSGTWSIIEQKKIREKLEAMKATT